MVSIGRAVGVRYDVKKKVLPYQVWVELHIKVIYGIQDHLFRKGFMTLIKNQSLIARSRFT